MAKIRNTRNARRLSAINVLRVASNVADGETVTIDGTVFEATTDGTVATGRIPVDVSAAVTPTAFLTALVAALNGAGIPWQGTKISANEMLIVGSRFQSKAAACSETLAGSNNAWAAATCYGGEGPAEDLPVTVLVQRVPNATEVAIGNMHFHFGFAPTSVMAFVRVTSTGIPKAWVGATLLSGNRVTVDNSGATDWAETDTVIILASK